MLSTHIFFPFGHKLPEGKAGDVWEHTPQISLLKLQNCWVDDWLRFTPKLSFLCRAILVSSEQVFAKEIGWISGNHPRSDITDPQREWQTHKVWQTLYVKFPWAFVSMENQNNDSDLGWLAQTCQLCPGAKWGQKEGRLLSPLLLPQGLLPH